MIRVVSQVVPGKPVHEDGQAVPVFIKPGDQGVKVSRGKFDLTAPAGVGSDGFVVEPSYLQSETLSDIGTQ